MFIILTMVIVSCITTSLIMFFKYVIFKICQLCLNKARIKIKLYGENVGFSGALQAQELFYQYLPAEHQKVKWPFLFTGEYAMSLIARDHLNLELTSKLSLPNQLGFNHGRMDCGRRDLL